MTTIIRPIGAPFDLTITEAETTETIVTSTKAMLNLPPAGTLMRATLGNTSIEFQIKKQNNTSNLNHKVFHGTITGAGHSAFRQLSFWVEVPWVFEILTLDEVDS